MAKAKSAPKDKQHIMYGHRRFDLHILTQEEAEVCLEKWKDRLGLRDWAISMRVFRKIDMPMPEAQGCVTMSDSKMCASIFLLDPVDYHPNCMTPQDMEKTIVHELLHVLLKPLKVSAELDDQEEQFIEKLSSSLVGIDRGHFN